MIDCTLDAVNEDVMCKTLSRNSARAVGAICLMIALPDKSSAIHNSELKLCMSSAAILANSFADMRENGVVGTLDANAEADRTAE